VRASGPDVKEIYADPAETTPGGYSVYLKTESGSRGGRSWYWYEKLSSGNAIVGLGAPACIGCHGGAGMNAANTPSPGSRDLVFTPVHP
jgi:hypothetical protein